MNVGDASLGRQYAVSFGDVKRNYFFARGCYTFKMRNRIDSANDDHASQAGGMIEGLSHITFIVRDLDRMQEFLESVFDATEIYASGDNTFSISRERFLLISGIWIAIMEGEPLNEKSYNHVAFKIRDADYQVFADRLRKLGVDLREGRSRVGGEGRSLYFHDYDNHLFELHTGTLEQRLARYLQSEA